ncbi:MAG TPA: gamma-glutamylcyclotransferase family protein [Solirubrobacteraceae bacterium]|nr:gamma-glutamylcyclotransferase family protein [Solirubrobacteraceae bacterium]
MSILYFAYGSNMDAATMERHCPDYRVLGAAELRDHRLGFTRRSKRTGTGVADILPAPGESVWGVLYDLDDSQLAAIDEKEGNGWAYQRKLLTVLLHDRAVVHEAHAYAVIVPDDAHVPPSAEYLGLIRAAARSRGLPAEYLARLDALTPSSS